MPGIWGPAPAWAQDRLKTPPGTAAEHMGTVDGGPWTVGSGRWTVDARKRLGRGRRLSVWGRRLGGRGGTPPRTVIRMTVIGMPVIGMTVIGMTVIGMTRAERMEIRCARDDVEAQGLNRPAFLW